MANKLTQIAREILEIEEDLQYRLQCLKGSASIDDFEMHTFEQVWRSTALGFGGIGEQTFTTARTYVFIPQNDREECFVYFAGRFAYMVDWCSEFSDDVYLGKMPSVTRAEKYKKFD